MTYTPEELQQWIQVCNELEEKTKKAKDDYKPMKKELNLLKQRIKYNSDPILRAKYHNYYKNKKNPDAIEYKKDMKRRTRQNDTRTIKQQVQTETIEQLKTTIETDRHIVKFGF